MADLRYISEGNSKTECFSFDLPARDTCPGKTDECSKDCYAARLMRIYKEVDAKYARNFEFSKSAKFVPYMIANIPANCQFRIHVSGDFYSVAYIRKWEKIVSARKDVTFYAYTRSWSKPRLWHRIQWLHLMDQININLSVDDETGKPNVIDAERYRWCYLTKTDNVPDWIRENDIVFRSNHLGQKRRRKNAKAKGIAPPPLVKRLGGQVCPLEQGRDTPKFSCAKCRLCVDKPQVPSYV